MGIDKVAVLGTISVGIGGTQLDGFLASIKIYSMSDKTYKDALDWNYEILKDLAEESMKKAGAEERKFAIKHGQLHEGMFTTYLMVVIK